MPWTPVSPTCHPQPRGRGYGSGDTAGGVDHGRDHEKRGDAEDHAQHRQQPDADPTSSDRPRALGRPATPGLPEQSDPDGLDEWSGRSIPR